MSTPILPTCFMRVLDSMSENPYFRYNARFAREIFENSFKEHPTEVSAHVKLDNINTYRLNSSGYRSDEFGPGAELVVAGCSFTFGSGVPEDWRWGAAVARDLGMKETNLGVCAWSTQLIIENIFAYVKKYGAPKKLLCLFPDPSRSPLSAVEGFLEYDDGFDGDRQVVNVMLERMTDYEYSDKPKYSRRPYQIDDVIPIELPMYFYFKYIQMLEEYCAVSGIELLWSTWDRQLGEYLEDRSDGQAKHLMHGFRNYVELGSVEWDWDISVEGGGMVATMLEDSKRAYGDCHPDLEKQFGDNFYMGTDVEGLVHWGVHKHVHIAEKFVGAISDR